MADFQVNDIIGKPFKDGGRGPDAYDCWGLVMEVFRRQGIELPDYGKDTHSNESERISGIIKLLAASDNWSEIKRPVRGCLITLKYPKPQWTSHVGVMLDRDRFINIRRKTRVLASDRISSPAWRLRIAGFYIYNG